MAPSGVWENAILSNTPTLMVYVECYSLQYWFLLELFLPNVGIFAICYVDGICYSQLFFDIGCDRCYCH